MSLGSPNKSKKGGQTGVQVFVRARPFNGREESGDELGNAQVIQFNGSNAARMLNPKKDMEAVREEFVFDHCFDSTRKGRAETQADVYQKMGPQLVENCLAGYNACLFAYGQTGSGKTHTMMGDLESDVERGIIPRLCDDLFRSIEIKKQSAGAATFKVEASYLEIYCEKVHDLLGKGSSDLQVRSNPEKGVYVDGLTTHKVSCASDVYKLLNMGAKKRVTASTNMNERSSRSHAILTLQYAETMFASSGGKQVQTRSKTSRVYLVDLAGSERTKTTGCTGVNLEEAKKINQSLTTLGRIIDMLADRKPGTRIILPVRESLLTWLLGDSLGGNSKTIMMAAVSPSAMNFDETLNTLRYAARTRCIVNETSVNEVVDMKLMEDLRGQIDDLLDSKNELENLKKSNEDKMSELEKLLEDERLAKERQNAEAKENAEREKRELQERLAAEKAALENDLHGKLAEGEQGKKLMQERFEAALKDLASKTMEEKGELQKQVDHLTKTLAEVEQRTSLERQDLQNKLADACRRLDQAGNEICQLQQVLQALEQQKLALGGTAEGLQRSLAEAQRDLAFQQQAASQEKQLSEEKLEYVKQRCADVEKDLQSKEQQWGSLKEEMIAQREADLAQQQSCGQAKLSELGDSHEQALRALQGQSEERFQKLREESKQQLEDVVQRSQQQQQELQAAMDANKKQHLEECCQLKQEHDNAIEELKEYNKRQVQELQAASEEAKKQHSSALEQVRDDSKQKLEELQASSEAVKRQHEEECRELKLNLEEARDAAQLKQEHEEALQAAIAKLTEEHKENMEAQLAQLNQQHGDSLEEIRESQRAQETLLESRNEQAKQQYEEECQRVREQQMEVVKEAQRKCDAALLEMKKKSGEDLEKQKKAQDDKVAKLKSNHDEALMALQSKIDERWKHLTQEHNNNLSNQSQQHRLEVEELEMRIKEVEGQVADKEEQADRVRNESSTVIQKLREKLQKSERNHMDEVGVLGQTASTLRRLLEQQIDSSKQVEEQMKAHQRRLELNRNAVMKEAHLAMQNMPSDVPWLAPAQSPRFDPGDLSPLKSPSQKDGLIGYKSSNDHLDICGSPDIRRHYKNLVGSDTVVKTVVKTPSQEFSSPQKEFDIAQGGLEKTTSFNAGDSSQKLHPDHTPLELEF